MPLQQETLHRLNGVASRLEEITRRLQEPAVVQDHTQYRSLMKEYDRLVPVVEAYKAYNRAQAAAEEAVTKWLEGKTVVKAICVPGKLVNLVVK